VFDGPDHAAGLFGLREFGNIYTRIMNPTTDAFERRIADLEGGVAAVATASGQSAQTLALLNLAQAGDSIVASSSLYGGTFTLLKYTLGRLGITTRFVDVTDPEAFARAIDETTKAVYVETVGNPRLDVPDFRAIADVAHAAGVPLVVDNTFAPLLSRPIEHGADVVVHSATKWIGGHGTSIGGIVIDGGNFDWAAQGDRFPTLNQPDPSYHGAVWTEAAKPLGPIAYILRMRTCLLRDLGAPMSPFNAFMFLQGLETLPLRMERHCANALRVAAWLSQHPRITSVIHPSLAEGEAARRAEAHLKGGMGSLIGFEMDGGKEAGQAFIEKLKLLYHVANIGDARSLAIHPASTTHSQLDEAALAAAGVTPGYIRLSIGIEHIDDILADLEQALA
jgi:O-acetylhomoserine (thiol)-lyase